MADFLEQEGWEMYKRTTERDGLVQSGNDTSCDEAIFEVATSIGELGRQGGGDLLCGTTLEVRDVLLRMGIQAVSSKAKRSVLYAITSIVGGSAQSVQALFSTDVVYQFLLDTGTAAVSSDEADCDLPVICCTIANLCDGNKAGQDLLNTRPIMTMLRDMCIKASTDNMRLWVGNAIASIIENNAVSIAPVDERGTMLHISRGVDLNGS
jgi:hypothetical protein